MPFTREIIADEFIGTGAGKQGPTRQRVLSLVDKLYRDQAITVDMWLACGTLRNMLMMEMGSSEGVSSYGQNVRASDATGKADRLGKRYTGFRVTQEGRILNPGDPDNKGGRRSRSNEWALEDAIFAAVGVTDQTNAKRVNIQHAEILIRIVCDTEAMPTLTEVARDLTGYYSGAKQLPPFAMGMITNWLGRLALHFRDGR